MTAPRFACLRGRRLMRPDSIPYAIITGSYLFQWFCSGFTSASKCVVVQLHVISEKIKDFTWPHFAGESSPQGFPVVTSKYVCFAYLFFLRSCSSMISFKADTSGKRCDHVVRACNDFNISNIYILSLSIIWSSFLIPGSLGSQWLWVGVWKRGKQAEVQPGSFARDGCHHVIVSRTKGLRGTPTLSLRRNEQFKEPLGVTEPQESQEFQSGWIMIVLSCICCHKLQDWKIFKTCHVDIIFETRGICQVQPLCLQNVHLRYAADHMPASFRLFQEMNYQLSASRLHMSHMVPPASTFRIQWVSSVFRSCQYHHSP